MENEKVLKDYADEIVKQFGVDQNRAEELARKLIIQIEAHGGVPSIEHAPKTVSVVIKSWLELGV